MAFCRSKAGTLRRIRRRAGAVESRYLPGGSGGSRALLSKGRAADPDRSCALHRSGRQRLCGESRPSRWQRHGVGQFDGRLDPETIGIACGGGAQSLRLGVLANSSSPNFASVAKNLTVATQTKGLSLVMADARSAEEFDSAFALLLRENVQAMMLASNVLFNLNRQRIADFTTMHRLPSMFPIREYVEAGGLMSYCESFREFYRRSASHVDRIIKGAKAGDLPIEQPSRSISP